MPKSPVDMMLEAQDREFKQRVRGRYYEALRNGMDKSAAAAYANDPDAAMPKATAPVKAAPKVFTPPVENEERAPIEAAMPAPTPKEVEEAKEVMASMDVAVADDFTKINGVGPRVSKQLEKMGYTTFGQIAEWSKEDAEKVDGALRLKGRVTREDWVAQAKALAG